MATAATATQAPSKKKRVRARPSAPTASTHRGERAADLSGLAPSGTTVLPAGMFADLPLPVDPARLLELQNEYTRDVSRLWSSWVEGRPIVPPSDKRFATPLWQGLHAYLAEVYLANSRYMTGLAESVEVDERSRAKIRFAVQQWIDAMSPANYLATNPDAQNKLIETSGESLASGLMNLIQDVQKGHISQTDETAFEIGRNVGITSGSVVFENEWFQIIQYQPSTPTTFERPLLMIPPCINKFYILDLQPENSLVRYAVGEGHTVLLVSWRNPMAEHAAWTWDEYIEEGAIRAIHVAKEISGQASVDILGFCVGGTIIATALAVLAARGEHPAASLTLLTTLLDFNDSGTLEVFIDEAQVQLRERTIGGLRSDGTPGGNCGLMTAQELQTTFSFLRPNDLVWNYVVSNYLKGEHPTPFDILYWNADSTNLPGPFFVWYLRNAYLENRLKSPGQTKVGKTAVDFGRIRAPTYLYGSREDHIVPWRSAYASTALLKGPMRFVLGASGHIAGVVNPPAKKRRNYWTYAPPQEHFAADANDWFQAATEVPGSWWQDWSEWLARHSGRRVKAPSRPGNSKYRPIEPAPGRYVRVRAV